MLKQQGKKRQSEDNKIVISNMPISVSPDNSVAWAFKHFKESGGEEPPLNEILLSRTPTPIPPLIVRKRKHRQ